MSHDSQDDYGHYEESQQYGYYDGGDDNASDGAGGETRDRSRWWLGGGRSYQGGNTDVCKPILLVVLNRRLCVCVCVCVCVSK